MKLHVQHTTDYRYTEPLGYALQTLWLTPQSGVAQTVKSWCVEAPGKLFAQADTFGNTIHSYALTGLQASDVSGSRVSAAGLVDTLGRAQFTDDERLPPAQLYLRATPLASPHLLLAEFGRRYLPPPQAGKNPELQALLALSAGVSSAVSYQKNSTNVTTTALQAFEAGAGVCQDQAHVMVAVCRSLGVAARYVSGYFYAANEPELASHAWVDVCLDMQARRWASIDVTHGCLTDERHVRLAMGLDYSACPPIRGVRHGGGLESMTVSISIKPA